ncbi:MAG: 3-methylornithyl-N6-L-lysine dehydrogenase PylD [Peptostreptococcaceae bacterium]|nr:3-methylornithyl-N6-L-lysine dehydrogenase PylD [Peptostreptococcaceae bacterium]MDY5738643.1 3-methylornithyl-N6-L-lysine dehydrogenase PylD [Anaerovoracaceae bacterium]
MTRLKTEWIEGINRGMQGLDRHVEAASNLSLFDMLCRIMTCNKEEAVKRLRDNKICVIPITQGQGIIGEFSESIRGILSFIGANVEVSPKTDVSGMHYAIENRCNIVYFADDERYLAVDLKNFKSAENDFATADAYIKILLSMMKKHGRDEEEEILVIGLGRVGTEAVKILREKNKNFKVYDKKISILNNTVCDKIKAKEEIKLYRNILDFTNEGAWLTKDLLAEDALIATPGVPCSVDEELKNALDKRLVNDFLEIGTISMLGLLLR